MSSRDPESPDDTAARSPEDAPELELAEGIHELQQFRTEAVQELVTKADSGDERANQFVDVFLQRFGQAIATVINILDPDVIVLGGGLSNIDHLYTTGPKEVMRHVFNDELRTPLIRNQHGDSSGVRGAAQLWPADEG